MKDHPGVNSNTGTTDMPVSQPETGSLSDRSKNQHPGTEGCETATPTAKPESGSLSNKAMKDHPGTPQ